MPHLLGIFVSCTYLAITGVVEVFVGCVFAYICNNVESTSLKSMLTV